MAAIRNIRWVNAVTEDELGRRHTASIGEAETVELGEVTRSPASPNLLSRPTPALPQQYDAIPAGDWPVANGAVDAAGEQRAVGGEGDRVNRAGAGVELGDLGACVHVP